jgi:hypothetical protein
MEFHNYYKSVITAKITSFYFQKKKKIFNDFTFTMWKGLLGMKVLSYLMIIKKNIN